MPDAGTYQYRLCYMARIGPYEVRSRPSVPKTVVLAAPAEVNVAVHYYHWTLRQRYPFTDAPVYVETYRTTAGGSVFYLLPTFPPGGGSTCQGTIPNDPRIEGVVMVDDFLDSDGLANQPQLYTEGGYLANDPPTPSEAGCVWRNRLWLLHGRELWHSKELIAGRWPEMSATAQVLELPADDADGTQLIPLPNMLVATKPDSRYGIGGWPGNDQGQGSSLSEPDRLPGEWGALADTPAFLIDDGAMIITRRGPALLDFGGQVSLIGEKIRATLDAYPVFRDGACNPKRGQAWILAQQSAEPNASVVLLWDMIHKQWSTVTPVPTGGVAQNVGVVDGEFYYTTVSLVHKQSDGIWDDDGMWYGVTITTPWLRPAGVHDEWRTRRLVVLGDILPDPLEIEFSELEIEIYYDHGATPGHTLAWNESALTDMAAYPHLKLRVTSPRQRVQAVKYSIRETESSPIAQGFAFDSLRVEFGINARGGSRKVAQQTPAVT